MQTCEIDGTVYNDPDTGGAQMNIVRVFKIVISSADGSKMTFNAVTKMDGTDVFCVHDGIENLNINMQSASHKPTLSFIPPCDAKFAHFGAVECRPLGEDFRELIEWLATRKADDE